MISDTIAPHHPSDVTTTAPSESTAAMAGQGSMTWTTWKTVPQTNYLSPYEIRQTANLLPVGMTNPAKRITDYVILMTQEPITNLMTSLTLDQP